MRPEQQEKLPWESPHSKSTNTHLRAWVALATHYRFWPGRQGSLTLLVVVVQGEAVTVKRLNWKESPGVSYAEYCGHSHIFTPRRATYGSACRS